MEPIIRGLAIYFFLLIVFRIAGKRTLAEVSSFDLVLLLIISETTQESMVDDDHSMTNGMLLILTLVGASIALSLIKQRSKKLNKILEGTPLVVVDHGRMLKERMDKSRVDEDDILEAARMMQGLERIDQIKYAVLERDGTISVVPKEGEGGGGGGGDGKTV